MCWVGYGSKIIMNVGLLEELKCVLGGLEADLRFLRLNIGQEREYFRGERLTPQMGVFSKCLQSMRAHVCYSQT
jgi:hypothetical protein